MIAIHASPPNTLVGLHALAALHACLSTDSAALDEGDCFIQTFGVQIGGQT